MALKRVVTDDRINLMEDDKCILSVTERIEDGKVAIKLEGGMRSDTEHELLDELVAFSTLGLNIEINMSGVEYISAAAQQVLLAVQQKMDELGRGSMSILGLTPVLREEFEKTGLSELLLIED